MIYRFVKIVPVFDGLPTSSAPFATDKERVESAPRHIEHFEPGHYALVKREGNAMLIVGEWKVKQETAVEVVAQECRDDERRFV